MSKRRWSTKKSKRGGAKRWHEMGNTSYRSAKTACGPVEVEFGCTVPEPERLVGGSRRIACTGQVTYKRPLESKKELVAKLSKQGVVTTGITGYGTTKRSFTVTDMIVPGEHISSAVARLKRKARNVGDNAIRAFERDCRRSTPVEHPFLLSPTRLYGEMRRRGATLRARTRYERD